MLLPPLFEGFEGATAKGSYKAGLPDGSMWNHFRQKWCWKKHVVLVVPKWFHRIFAQIPMFVVNNITLIMQKDEVDYSIDIFYLPFISIFQTYMQKELKFIGIFKVTLEI